VFDLCLKAVGGGGKSAINAGIFFSSPPSPPLAWTTGGGAGEGGKLFGLPFRLLLPLTLSSPRAPTPPYLSLIAARALLGYQKPWGRFFDMGPYSQWSKAGNNFRGGRNEIV